MTRPPNYILENKNETNKKIEKNGKDGQLLKEND